MKIFITGSTTGLGLIACDMLKKAGHELVLHARNKNSPMNANSKYVIGDLSILSEIKSVAEQANTFGSFDCIIHNAGVYNSNSNTLFTVNVLAPYLLSALMTQPKRMVFLSSGMHMDGSLNLDMNNCSYSDTKLFDLMLAKYFSKLWPDSFVNAVDPGWVPTRMGGDGAPDDLAKGAETQVWLATSEDSQARVSGKYFHHLQQMKSNPIADSESAQEELVAYLKLVL